MAIRVPTAHSFQTLSAFAYTSGWRTVVFGSTQSNLEFRDRMITFSQPSALSRPGNLGTAYAGVWTGNRA